MNSPHFNARVIDAQTGEELEGIPTRALYQACRFSQPAFSYHREGEWVLVGNAPESINWHKRHGHEIRQVRIDSGEQLEASR